MNDSSNESAYESRDEELALLLAGEVLGNLDDAERSRLEELSVSSELNDAADLLVEKRGSLTRVANSIGVASELSSENFPSNEEGMQMTLDPELAEKIRRDAIAYLPTSSAAISTKPKTGFLASPWVGWCVAAGLAFVCASLWFSETGQPQTFLAESVSSRQTAQSWIQTHPGAIALEWEIKDAAIVASDSQPGRIVWDAESQTGFMSFNALPINDASVQQYQLWIIDPQRDEEPIDGGVFDIMSAGESFIPIRAKLDVIEPLGFAVTVEKPGGVVVSDQSRLPLLAMVPQD